MTNKCKIEEIPFRRIECWKERGSNPQMRITTVMNRDIFEQNNSL